MLDGLTCVMRNDKVPAILEELATESVYTRKERMMDSEKLTFYLKNCEVWTVMLYFDPRRDQEHRNPRRAILHHVMTQYENLLFHQLEEHQLIMREGETLASVFRTEPSLLYFDFMLGVWDTQSWKNVFPFFPGLGNESVHFMQNASASPEQNTYTQDYHYSQGKLKICLYNYSGLDLKFYRLNPEQNKNHALKYPWGWAGYTKCEIVTPKFFFPDIVQGKMELEHVIRLLQAIRTLLVGESWDEHSKQVATKTYARSDRIHLWSSTEQPLQGSMELFESEMTRRQNLSATSYILALETIVEKLSEKARTKLQEAKKTS
jgi:hypothetical protein